MLRIPVTYDLVCEIKQDINYCMQNLEHCLITRNGQVVAIIYLSPITIEKGADLLEWEKEEVLKVVKENQYELEEAYRRVLNGW